jgi:TonB family protein
MSKLSPESDRDQRQRAFGFIGFSAMAHIGILAVLAFAPHAPQLLLAPAGSSQGTSDAGEMTFIDVAEPNAGEGLAQNDAPINSTDAAPSIPASTSDSSDVLIPQTVDVKPEEKSEEQQAPLPTQLPSKLPAKAATKSSSKAPAKIAKSAKFSAPLTDETGDTEVMKALKASRDEDKSENTDDFLPEKLPVPVRIAERAPAQPMDESEPQVMNESPAPDENTKPAATPEPVAAVVPRGPVAENQATQPTAPKGPVAVHEASSQGHDSPTTSQLAANTGSRTGANSQVSAASGTGHTGAGDGGGTALGVPNGAMIRDAGKLMARPGNPNPVYPQADRLNRREGVNSIIGRVQPDGSVSQVFLERSSGSAQMDQAAMKAFKQWKFMPGQEGFVRQPFRFQLVGEAQDINGQLRR